jgi:hypothetical protein
LTGLGVVGWFLGGQKITKAGQFFLWDFFNRVFELPSPRNAQNLDKKQIDKKSVLGFCQFFCKKNVLTRFVL